jgi:hypothetical protein
MSKSMSILIWLDAHATLDELSADDVRGGHRPHPIHTFGYIVISDAEGVSIAGEWLPANNGGEDTYRSITFVPRAMVVSEAAMHARKPRKVRVPPQP